MRFLVLGASGMAGHVICIYLKESGHEVTGLCRTSVSFVDSIEGDVRDMAKLRQLIDTGRFDVVVNVVGILNQFAETDKEAAVFLNGYLPHFLAKCTESMSTMVIHMSTDCVFSGESGPYTEAAFCDGRTFYSRTKAVGELNDNKNLTLRSSIVGPDLEKDGIGLLNWFMQQSEVKGYTKAMWTGMTTLELARTIEAAAKEKVHGLINMVYQENISKYELLKLFNHYMRSDKVNIKPEEFYVIDKTLVRTNYDFDYAVPAYEIMISDMADWMRKHKELYPHYRL